MFDSGTAGEDRMITFVASGKGVTRKTLVATSLAFSLSDKGKSFSSFLFNA